MKLRNFYVSNSSSSSFIVTKDLTDKGINCIKLTDQQKQLINGFNNWNEIIVFDMSKDYYLTQFISDCTNKYDEIINTEHIFYQQGDLGEEPREEFFYNEYQKEYGQSVFLLKQHDVAQQTTFNKFVKEYKKADLPQKVLIKYEDDGIKLIYVW